MSVLDEREKAFEHRYAHDEALRFRILARRNRLVAAWAAERLGFDGAAAEAYMADIVATLVEPHGSGHLAERILGDLEAGDAAPGEAELHAQIAALERRAKREIATEEDGR